MDNDREQIIQWLKEMKEAAIKANMDNKADKIQQRINVLIKERFHKIDIMIKYTQT